MLQSDTKSFIEMPFSYYFIYDLQKSTFDFVEKKIENVLGYKVEEIDTELFLNKINAADLQDILKHENLINKFIKGISIESYFDYVFRYDYRILTRSGTEKRILQEVNLHLIDEAGLINKVFVRHTDITGLQISKPSLSIIGLNGKESKYNLTEDDEKNTDFNLTKREKEIVKLLAKNYSSAQISKELYISIHTVNTHRKNILSKSKCNNVLELILLLKQKDWSYFQ